VLGRAVALLVAAVPPGAGAAAALRAATVGQVCGPLRPGARRDRPAQRAPARNPARPPSKALSIPRACSIHSSSPNPPPWQLLCALAVTRDVAAGA
jgi:hypothetical protein